MTSTTQLYAVRRALVDALQARAGLAGVSVTYGWPGDDRVERSMVYTDAGGTGVQEVTAMRAGRTYYDETGRLDLTIRTHAVGGTQQDADDLAEALALEVAQTVADDRTLGGTVLWIKAVSWIASSAYGDTGYLAQLTYTFEYFARLT